MHTSASHFKLSVVDSPRQWLSFHTPSESKFDFNLRCKMFEATSCQCCVSWVSHFLRSQKCVYCIVNPAFLMPFSYCHSVLFVVCLSFVKIVTCILLAAIKQFSRDALVYFSDLLVKLILIAVMLVHISAYSNCSLCYIRCLLSRLCIGTKCATAVSFLTATWRWHYTLVPCAERHTTNFGSCIRYCARCRSMLLSCSSRRSFQHVWTIVTR